MPTNGFSYNLNVLPADNPSAFKLFVQSRDELGSTQSLPSVYQAGNSDDPKPLTMVVQDHFPSSDTWCQSIFIGHQLAGRSGVPEIHKSEFSGFTLMIILGCFTILAAVRFFYYKRVNLIFRAFFVPRVGNQVVREGGLFRDRITPPLMLVYLVSTTLLIYSAACNIGLPGAEIGLNFRVAGLIFCVITGYLLLRLLLIQIVGLLFKTKTLTSAYIANSVVSNLVAGIFILPMILVTFTTTDQLNEVMVYSGICVFLLFSLFRFIKGVIIGIRIGIFSSYYLIVYLCTIEILPPFILVKLVFMYFLEQ